MKLRTWIGSGLALLLAYAASAELPREWIENDWAAAQETAREQEKDILLNFSGSDWCGWCIRLDQEVFGRPEFAEEAARDFVLVVLDFPRNPENQARIPEPQREANERAREAFGVQGFPTVLLLDSDARVYARTGYRSGGPGAYLEHLAELKTQRDQREGSLAEARNPDLSPADRARALDRAFEGVDRAMLMTAYRAEVDEIIESDSENELGLRNKYLPIARMQDIEGAARAGDAEAALGILDRLVEEIEAQGEMLQDLLGVRFSLLRMADRGDEARATLRHAIDAAPQGRSAEAMRQHYEHVYDQDAPAGPGGE